jgi:putative glutamine amidotransferase
MEPGPLVAVPTYHLAPGGVPRWRPGGYALPDTYVHELRRAGARPVLLPAGRSGPAGELLEPFDGLLLAGGGDLDPATYGAAPHAATGSVDPDRDDLELALARAADERGMPTLAICRGVQVLNVAFGGSLRQHLPDLDGLVAHRGDDGGPPAMHPLRLLAGSRLAAAVDGTADGAAVVGLSQHHQGIDRVGDGLVPTAWGPDGIVEALERERGWMVGVLWHPEATAAADPVQHALLAAFVEQAARFGGRGRGR